jgi:hypothetical protein
VQQCAKRANLTVSMVKRAVKNGELKAKKVRQRGTGAEYRVLESDLQQWLGSRQTAETVVQQPPISLRHLRPPLPNFLER